MTELHRTTFGLIEELATRRWNAYAILRGVPIRSGDVGPVWTGPRIQRESQTTAILAASTSPLGPPGINPSSSEIKPSITVAIVIDMSTQHSTSENCILV